MGSIETNPKPTTVGVRDVPIDSDWQDEQGLKVGAHGGQVHRRTRVKKDECGTLFITSRRLVFIGAARSTTVQMNRVVRVEATTDPPILMVVVEGSRTKNLFFYTSEAPLLAAGIETILAQAC